MTAGRNVLVIGGPKAGKTHYGAQLLSRLQYAKQSLLQIDPLNPVKDSSPLREALDSIEEGRAAKHTMVDKYGEMGLDMLADGRRFSLLWPDYGGEQIKHILESHAVTPEWSKRLRAPNDWILFLRLDSLNASPPIADIIARIQPREDGSEPATRASNSPWENWDENAKYVELLQILAHAAGLSILQPITTHRLLVMLSCWDKLTEEERKALPIEVLRKRLPMVAEFVEATWASPGLSVWGLSSLGKDLNAEEPDEEFCAKGPENAGYVIDPQGNRMSDLTAPIHYLLS